MDNKQKVYQFFHYLREMIMSLVQNQNDDGEIRELTYLANYLKEMVADAIQEREVGNIPLLSFTVYGSRDGKTAARFEITRNEQIIKSWSLSRLAKMLSEAKDKWDSTMLEQPEEVTFDMSPYKLLMDELLGKKED